eukprot:gene9750-biopygen3246
MLVSVAPCRLPLAPPPGCGCGRASSAATRASSSAAWRRVASAPATIPGSLLVPGRVKTRTGRGPHDGNQTNGRRPDAYRNFENIPEEFCGK